jgi:hypothetical protein
MLLVFAVAMGSLGWMLRHASRWRGMQHVHHVCRVSQPVGIALLAASSAVIGMRLRW